VIGIDKSAWQQELALHAELFQQLAHHLPQELPATKARIERDCRLTPSRAPAAVKLQLLSDLHLETEDFDPQPAPAPNCWCWPATSTPPGPAWALRRLAGAGDLRPRQPRVRRPRPRGRGAALRRLRRSRHPLLQRESCALRRADGRRVRFVGVVRWSDFDLFGAAQRERAMRAARLFHALMAATPRACPSTPTGCATRAWPTAPGSMPSSARPARADGSRTVVVTHFAPSLRSADPRFGRQPGTASFCNADDDLLPLADLWLHGHLHCRHDYRVGAAGRPRRGWSARRVAWFPRARPSATTRCVIEV
jgi:hypothetical protein